MMTTNDLERIYNCKHAHSSEDKHQRELAMQRFHHKEEMRQMKLLMVLIVAASVLSVTMFCSIFG